MRYKSYTLEQVGPPSERKALASRFPQHDRSFGIYSKSNRITLHNQVCRLFTGDLLFLDLKLYLKDGVQYAKTVNRKRAMHFRKIHNIWIRVR